VIYFWDTTLELFKKVITDQEFEIPDHFAIVPEPSAGANKNHKEGCLLGLRIRPIWYPAGEHQFVERFLTLAIDMAEGRIKPF
jgi:hypothetical protein